jgi:sterol desaturase/sphingolipid hydroxylase (fatty acid hydroxylase superfamily)
VDPKLWWQLPIVFVLADFLSYWQHRFFHRAALWPIHAAHHSSREVDWLSSGRFHPLNEIGAQLLYVAPLLALGFHPFTFLVLVPYTAWYVVELRAASLRDREPGLSSLAPYRRGRSWAAT